MPHLVIESTGWPSGASGISVEIFDRDLKPVETSLMSASSSGKVVVDRLWPGYVDNGGVITWPPDNVRPIFVRSIFAGDAFASTAAVLTTGLVEVGYPPATTACYAQDTTTSSAALQTTIATTTPTLPITGQSGFARWAALGASAAVALGLLVLALVRKEEPYEPRHGYRGGR